MARRSVETSIAESLTKERVFYEQCDTGDMESVRDFAKKVQKQFPAVHVLINNGEIFCKFPLEIFLNCVF